MFVGMVLNQHFMPRQIKITNDKREQMVPGEAPGCHRREEKTGAREGKACPWAVNGRKPSVWGSREDIQGQVCFCNFCLKVIQKRTGTPG